MKAKVLVTTLLVFLFSCLKDEPTNTSETAHFIIKHENGQATAAEIEEAKLFSESVYKEYETYFGSDRLPPGKTIINLGGDAYSGNGEPKIPFVNEQGEIFLYRFSTGYLGELPHEYAHVIRLYKGWSFDGFLEEGLAEAMSSKLFPENIGFSLYGYATTVAAGLWLREDQVIPLEELKDRHFDLNLKCLPQSYAIRADFFTFILEEYGKEEFMNFIYATDAATYEGYERAFGKSLRALDEQWLQNLEQRLDLIGDEATKIQAYKAKLNSLGFYVCRAGADF